MENQEKNQNNQEKNQQKLFEEQDKFKSHQFQVKQPSSASNFDIKELKNIQPLKPCTLSKYYTNIKKFDGLTQLHLWNQETTSIQAIKQIILHDFTHVQYLSLNGSHLTNEGLKLLLSASWPLVQQIWINCENVSQIQSLGKINLNQLTHFQLWKTNLGINGAKFIIDQVNQNKFNKLEVLTLSFDNSASDQCWKLLSENTFKQFPNLENLNVCKSQYIQMSTKHLISEWWRANQTRILFWFNIHIEQDGYNGTYLQKLKIK